MANAEDTTKGTELGKAAFERGLSRVPALDPDFMAMMVGREVGEGLPVIQAWLRAWDKANVAAPVGITVDIEATGSRTYAAIKLRFDGVTRRIISVKWEEADAKAEALRAEWANELAW